MLLFKKEWTLEEDFKAGDVIDIYSDGFGRMYIERHMSPEEKELHKKKKRLARLKEETKALEQELTGGQEDVS